MFRQYLSSWSVIGIVFVLSTVSLADEPAGGEQIRIGLIGDSTMASYAKPPADRPDLTGWGQVFGELFDERVQVHNHAASGRSSKSFLAEQSWQPVLNARPDYIFIQHAASFERFRTLGDEGSADLSASASDRTHFSRKGALAIARLVADALPEAVPELARHLKTPTAKRPD